MIESTDDQQQRAWEAEQNRIAQLIPGTPVRVYKARGAGFTTMKIVGIQNVHIQDARTKRWWGQNVYLMMDAYHNTYAATADFIERINRHDQ